MKKIFYTLIIMLFGSLALKSEEMKTLYDFKMKTLEGKEFDFSSLKGKKVMIVNTASKCGLTGQYKDLEKLYNEYKDKNFIIIGIPSNDFMFQEPGTAGEIREFCTNNYSITFPLMEKVKVKGKKKHPLYKWLTSKKMNGVSNKNVKWNFHKFLIDEKGHFIKSINPKTLPYDKDIVNWIKG